MSFLSDFSFLSASFFSTDVEADLSVRAVVSETVDGVADDLAESAETDWSDSVDLGLSVRGG